MKKLLALVLTFLMSANLVLSVYAGDDVGVSTQIDYEDIAGKLDSTSESTTETTEITTENYNGKCSCRRRKQKQLP